MSPPPGAEADEASGRHHGKRAEDGRHVAVALEDAGRTLMLAGSTSIYAREGRSRARRSAVELASAVWGDAASTGATPMDGVIPCQPTSSEMRCVHG
jgi:hypothetical protein